MEASFKMKISSNHMMKTLKMKTSGRAPWCEKLTIHYPGKPGRGLKLQCRWLLLAIELHLPRVASNEARTLSRENQEVI